MKHPLVKVWANLHRSRASLSMVIVSAAQVRWVNDVRILKCAGGFRVRCRISRWWWLTLGVWQLVVRRRVKRCLASAFSRWPDPGVVSVWVL